MATSKGDTRMKSAQEESVESYPKEIASSLKGFQDSLKGVENVLAPLINASMPDVHNQLSALDRAKLDLVSAYAVNSMFWVYLCTQGVNPREHAVRHELGRIQKYMKRAQEITDKEKAPKLVKGAAKRFIRNALSDPTQKGQGASRKRKADDRNQESPKRR